MKFLLPVEWIYDKMIKISKNAVMRKVSRTITLQRAPSAEKEHVNILLKQASEQYIGTFQKGDGVTGAPVTEPGYKQLLPYLMRLIWKHINKLGWHHDY